MCWGIYVFRARYILNNWPSERVDLFLGYIFIWKSGRGVVVVYI